MLGKLRKMRAERAKDDSGFTLIELLVVVVIIGVLVAIAVPLYLNYRKGAANKSAASDVRGAISAIEQFYTENANVYPATGNNTGNAGKALVFGTTTTALAATAAGGTLGTATVSPGNEIRYRNSTASYVLCAQNADGLQVWVYNSATGGSVAKSTQVDLTACLANGN
jgi:type IV pilus assembly protein PilA